MRIHLYLTKCLLGALGGLVLMLGATGANAQTTQTGEAVAITGAATAQHNREGMRDLRLKLDGWVNTGLVASYDYWETAGQFAVFLGSGTDAASFRATAGPELPGLNITPLDKAGYDSFVAQRKARVQEEHVRKEVAREEEEKRKRKEYLDNQRNGQ